MNGNIIRVEGLNQPAIETDWATLNKENTAESFQYIGNRFAENFKVYAVFEGRTLTKAIKIND
jgi:hypothetical protein